MNPNPSLPPADEPDGTASSHFDPGVEREQQMADHLARRIRSAALGSSQLYFQHGVASGDPLPDGVVIWTRLTPSPEAQPGTGRGPQASLTWQISVTPDFAKGVATGCAQTSSASDHTVKIDVSGLEANTEYYYRFFYNGTFSPVGRTRTAPAHSKAVASLRLGVTSFHTFGAGGTTCRMLAARDDLDFILHLGDGWMDERQAPDSKATETAELLTHYRNLYGKLKRESDVQALHARFTFIMGWCAGFSELNNSVARELKQFRQLTETGWVSNQPPHDEAVQAFYEWMPIRSLARLKWFIARAAQMTRENATATLGASQPHRFDVKESARCARRPRSGGAVRLRKDRWRHRE